MIKRLRFRFIFITMSSVLFVLTGIMAAINGMNYAKIRTSADTILEILIHNNGGFFPNENGGQEYKEPRPPKLNEETPFETRFFTVYLYDDGSTEVNTAQIAAIDEDTAVLLAEKVAKSTRGYYQIYRYRVQTVENGKFIVFMDCAKQLDTARSFLLYSVMISLCGILGVFILVFFLSKRAVRPIAEAYYRQKRFITNAGHELKTPLTIISANNEMLEIEQGENEYTQAIQRQITRMTDMVRNLTALSKLEENGLSDKERFSISDALNDVLDNFQSVFKMEQKEMYKTVEDSIMIVGNEALIRQLFQVLLDNALKYGMSYVKAELKRMSNRVVFTLENDTRKVPEGNLDFYFERFYRSEESRASAIEGSGIGLSIAREIVALHKGQIHAFGVSEKTFLIKLILEGEAS